MWECSLLFWGNTDIDIYQKTQPTFATCSYLQTLVCDMLTVKNKSQVHFKINHYPGVEVTDVSLAIVMSSSSVNEWLIEEDPSILVSEKS